MVYQAKVEILKNQEVASGYFRMAFAAPQMAKEARAGQFLQVKISDSCEPLLRRPFSIHHVKGVNIEILYEILGKGTEILSQRKPGGYLDVIGPLGNGFDLRTTNHELRTTILVAGGMGVAPLLFSAERLMDRKPLVLIGAKTKSQILCEKEFKDLGCEVKIATDDGSRGHKGKVTELLEEILVARHKSQVTGHKHETCGMGQETIICACGPKPMLKEISRISKEYNIPAQVSLEEHLACGIGACLGCVVKTKEGFKRVCKEGPVFVVDEIIW